MPLSQDEISACRRAFATFDQDGSGTIDVGELRIAMEALGQHPTEEELLAMIQMVDEDNSGQIEFAEFLKVVESHRAGAGRSDDESDTLAAFVAMGGNPDKSGYVEAEKLRATIKDFGLTINIDSVLRAHDDDASGRIDYSEFKAMLHFTPSHV